MLTYQIKTSQPGLSKNICTEWERMEKNVFAVCEDINARGAGTSNSYIKSCMSRPRDTIFFWDTDFLKVFIEEV